MVRYIASRLVQAVISILFIATAVFIVVRLTGDPINVYVPEYAPASTQELVRHRLGLDKPVIEQYASFLGGLLTLDLGTSFTSRPVLEILLEHLPATASLALVSVGVAVILAIPLGILSAAYRGSFIDTVARTIALFGQSVPSFWFAIMLILIFGVVLRWFPVAQQSGWDSYVLPAIAIGWAPVAGIVRLTRSSMLEVMDSDYVRMARAKGVPVQVIYVKHALRNAIIPVITYTGLVLAAFLNGSLVVENVFAWPGVGKMALDGVTSRDFPVVQGVVLMSAIFLIAINLLVDILYVFIDPRIRYR
jgi:peptide/nickel transport system permease protein